MKNRTTAIFTVVALAVVIALPIVGLVLRPSSAFGGADSAGQAAIIQINPNYKPWFNNVWMQSTRTSEYMFGFQGLLGGAILFSTLGFFVGRTRGRAEAANEQAPASAGAKAAYVLIGIATFTVIPVLYFVVGYKPPSSEIICLFFALSAAIAAGFTFFALFFFRGRRKGLKEAVQTCAVPSMLRTVEGVS
ncbi:MAG: energy-coupling factor ABC transporter substrate-binding protein [Actinobacteria bacterium]|nr:energy-coupling factor ABC transporter substrate-binding protein [Actinomycetota bacterium]